MKKLVSILLIAVMLMSALSVTVFADTNSSIDDLLKDQLYYKRFLEEYGYITFYHEEYYHHVDEKDANSDIDWALIRAATDVIVEPIDPPVPHYCTIGDIVYGSIYYYVPFETEFCVYDVAKDEFIDITKINIDDYDGLGEVFCTGKYGMIIGDVDADGSISILDATEIQLVQAKLSTLERNYRVADFDRDGFITVLDATEIQLELAGLDKPVVNEEMIMAVINSSSSTQPKPEDAVYVPFETKFSAQQFLSPIFDESSMPYDDVIFVIKSKEQYYSIFNSRAPEFADEFFESKWLVAVFERTGCYEAVASLDGISKYGDTLYVANRVYVPDNDGFVQPLDPFWLTIASVDREYLEDVYSVVKVK